MDKLNLVLGDEIPEPIRTAGDHVRLLAISMTKTGLQKDSIDDDHYSPAIPDA
jgi:hypothetical protein